MSNTKDFQDKGHTSVYYEGLHAGEEKERKRIIQLIKDTYEAEEFFELGSFVWTGDIIELIEGKKHE